MSLDDAVTMYKNVLLMRHPRFDITLECIEPAEEEICRDITRRLFPYIEGKRVHILHSPRDRCVLAAAIVDSELSEMGVRVVEIQSDPRLNLSTNSSGLSAVMSEFGGREDFYLLITHEPGICSVLKRERVDNGVVVGEDFEIGRLGA